MLTQASVELGRAQRMIVLRSAMMTDADFLLRVRNDRETRRQSVHRGRITQAQHQAWLHRTLKSPDTMLFVAQEGERDVGMARFDGKMHGVCQVSLAIKPRCRGDGLMQPLLEVLMAEARRRGYRHMRAQIRQSNTQSLRTFLRSGFATRSDAVMTLEVAL